MNYFIKANGSIAIFTMISMIFFLILVLGIYNLSNKNLQSEILSIEEIKNEYYSENIYEIYESKMIENNI